MEQAGQLQRPLDLLLAVRFQIGPQGVEKLPGVGVVLADKFLDERQELRQQALDLEMARRMAGQNLV